MPFGQPFEYLVDSWLNSGNIAFIGKDGMWSPCRVSFTKWQSSCGEWVEFEGYRDKGASAHLRSVCEHRPGTPRSFDHEELNFSPSMDNGSGQQMIHDPIAMKTDFDKLMSIIEGHFEELGPLEYEPEKMENFHLVTRREGRHLILEFIIEEPDYEIGIHGVPYSAMGMDADRFNAALNHLNHVTPCPDCASDEYVTLACEMKNVHGRYGNGLLLTGPNSLHKIIPDKHWVFIAIGERKLAIPKAIIELLNGYRWKELLVVPEPPARVFY
jgi:hypothetical protein